MKAVLIFMMFAMVCLASVAADADLDNLLDAAGKSMEALGNKWRAEALQDTIPAKNPICFVCKIVCDCNE